MQLPISPRSSDAPTETEGEGESCSRVSSKASSKGLRVRWPPEEEEHEIFQYEVHQHEEEPKEVVEVMDKGMSDKDEALSGISSWERAQNAAQVLEAMKEIEWQPEPAEFPAVLRAPAEDFFPSPDPVLFQAAPEEVPAEASAGVAAAPVPEAPAAASSETVSGTLSVSASRAMFEQKAAGGKAGWQKPEPTESRPVRSFRPTLEKPATAAEPQPVAAEAAKPDAAPVESTVPEAPDASAQPPVPPLAKAAAPAAPSPGSLEAVPTGKVPLALEESLTHGEAGKLMEKVAEGGRAAVETQPPPEEDHREALGEEEPTVPGQAATAAKVRKPVQRPPKVKPEAPVAKAKKPVAKAAARSPSPPVAVRGSSPARPSKKAAPAPKQRQRLVKTSHSVMTEHQAPAPGSRLALEREAKILFSKIEAVQARCLMMEPAKLVKAKELLKSLTEEAFAIRQKINQKIRKQQSIESEYISGSLASLRQTASLPGPLEAVGGESTDKEEPSAAPHQVEGGPLTPRAESSCGAASSTSFSPSPGVPSTPNEAAEVAQSQALLDSNNSGLHRKFSRSKERAGMAAHQSLVKRSLDVLVDSPKADTAPLEDTEQKVHSPKTFRRSRGLQLGAGVESNGRRIFETQSLMTDWFDRRADEEGDEDDGALPAMQRSTSDPNLDGPMGAFGKPFGGDLPPDLRAEYEGEALAKITVDVEETIVPELEEPPVELAPPAEPEAGTASSSVETIKRPAMATSLVVKRVQTFVTAFRVRKLLREKLRPPQPLAEAPEAAPQAVPEKEPEAPPPEPAPEGRIPGSRVAIPLRGGAGGRKRSSSPPVPIPGGARGRGPEEPEEKVAAPTPEPAAIPKAAPKAEPILPIPAKSSKQSAGSPPLHKQPPAASPPLPKAESSPPVQVNAQRQTSPQVRPPPAQTSEATRASSPGGLRVRPPPLALGTLPPAAPSTKDQAGPGRARSPERPTKPGKAPPPDEPPPGNRKGLKAQSPVGSPPAPAPSTVTLEEASVTSARRPSWDHGFHRHTSLTGGDTPPRIFSTLSPGIKARLLAEGEDPEHVHSYKPRPGSPKPLFVTASLQISRTPRATPVERKRTFRAERSAERAGRSPTERSTTSASPRAEAPSSPPRPGRCFPASPDRSSSPRAGGRKK